MEGKLGGKFDMSGKKTRVPRIITIPSKIVGFIVFQERLKLWQEKTVMSFWGLPQYCETSSIRSKVRQYVGSIRRVRLRPSLYGPSFQVLLKFKWKFL